MTESCLTLLMVSVAYGQWRIQGVKTRGMHPPTSYFQNVFDVQNFSLISNLFDSDRPCGIARDSAARGGSRKIAAPK